MTPVTAQGDAHVRDFVSVIVEHEATVRLRAAENEETRDSVAE
jgi:hypothetical protein